ncbi:hypothetical protein CCR90_18690 [Rhodovulum sulfidophilum]|uniref:class I SAM-dependent methyltransferase n=1 Tax=Rhodovulum sulfidophilum TaxID=35806 RepID=UPI001912D210|nr:class I SAM-dependent methyltransferase [Rhodovulum sulfidophilum]MBK5925748.1 hypothetical protein [Rhodovulum sulfidophilum]
MPSNETTPAASACGAGRTREDWNRRYSETEQLFGIEPNIHLARELSDLPPGRALDLACGEGRNGFWLAERGWQVDGIDLSDVAVERARALAELRGLGGRMTFHAADLSEFAPEPGRWDLVIMMYLHLPWDRLRPILYRAAEALVPGGTFFVAGHDLANFEKGHGGPKSPAVLYTAEDVAAALDDQIEIGLARQVERVVHVPDGERTALDCILRGRRRPPAPVESLGGGLPRDPAGL